VPSKKRKKRKKGKRKYERRKYILDWKYRISKIDIKWI